MSRGDSYPSEVGATVHLVMEELKCKNPHILAWQSKVGPLPWLRPFTDEAIKGYVQQGKKNFLLVPIAFVNDHIETLHELDIECCQDLKKEVNLNFILPFFFILSILIYIFFQLGFEMMRRVPTPNDHPLFIKALTDIVSSHLNSHQKISNKFLTRCPHCINPKCHSMKEWFAELCS